MDILTIFYHIAVFTILFCVAWGDIQHRIIEDRLLVAGVLVWGIYAWGSDVPVKEVVVAVSSAVVVYVLLLMVALVSEKITGRFAIGGGDLKLFALSALLVGPSHILAVMFLSSALGLCIYVIKAWPQGIFPFGPAIVGATCLFLMTL